MLGLLLVLLAQVSTEGKPPPIAGITLRTKAILDRLEEPVDLAFPKETPLDEVLQHIRRSARKAPDDRLIPIYPDPLGFQRSEKTTLFPVTIAAKGIRAKDAFTQLLEPLGLSYIVKDDLLIISDPQGIRRELGEVAVQAADASPATRALLARLEEAVRIPYPNETPLEDVLAYLARAAAKPSDDRGVKFIVVPNGLKEAGSSLSSTITMELEGVPSRLHSGCC